MAVLNWKQLYDLSSTTTFQSTDIFYLARSPYGVGNDFGFLYSSLIPVTTKGDLYTFSTVNARLGVGANGALLQADSGQATGLRWTTATYPTATSINQILYSSSNNVVDAIATGASSVLTTTAAGVPGFVGPLTNGQLIIGSTGATPVAAAITGTNGVTVTTGAGSITLSAAFTVTSVLYVAKNGNDGNNGSYNAPFLTIHGAIAAAGAGTLIIVFPGTYTENVTLGASMYIRAAEERSVFIVGNMTATYSGTTYLDNLDLQASAGDVLTLSGANATILQMDGVNINSLAGGGHCINHSNTNVSNTFIASNGSFTVAVSTTAKVFNSAATSVGTITFEDVSVKILDNIDHVCLNIAGTLSFKHTFDEVYGQVAIANTAAFYGIGLSMNTSTVAILTTSSTTISSLSQISAVTTANPAITGTGNISYVSVAYPSTGSGFAATLNGGSGAAPIGISSYKFSSAALTTLPYDGQLTYNGTHLYMTIGATNYQLDQQFTAPLGVTSGGTGTTTAFTAGSIVYAGVSGVYSQENANFFWDATNHRLGVNTAAPSANIEVHSTNVNTTWSTATGYGEYVYNTQNSIGANGLLIETTSANSGTWILSCGVNAGGGLHFPKFNVTGAGFVGIGTEAPSHELHVVGTGLFTNITFGGSTLSTFTDKTAWTPTITSAVTGDLSVTYSVNSGTYSVIGNMILLTFKIITSAFTHTTASGDLIIAGVPIAAGTFNGIGGGAVSFQGITKAGYTNFVTTIPSTQNFLNIAASGSGSAAANVQITDMPSAGTVILYGSLMYFL